MFKILNGYENIDSNLFFSVKEGRRTRGHGVTLAQKQCRLDNYYILENSNFHKEQHMNGTNCMGARNNVMLKNKIDIY